MTEEQMEIAAEFIDELQLIGVFEPILEGYDMKANCPLFAVAKPGQPGQWRIIADMKNGGQNAHVRKDPVHLPQAKGILEKLYTGGRLAIVDASKFFHNFPTLPQDRPYLRCIHPKLDNNCGILVSQWGLANPPLWDVGTAWPCCDFFLNRKTSFKGRFTRMGGGQNWQEMDITQRRGQVWFATGYQLHSRGRS
jgi:hypothetical protein